MNSKVAGRYEVFSVSDNEQETLLYEGANLITNSGLDLICTKGNAVIVYKCVVSTDNSPVIPGTHQVDSIVASSTNVISTTYGASDRAPYYYWHRSTFEFATSSANGNLTKVAILDDNDKLFSAALFKDIEGKSTTIQPIENERLRIIYEQRLYLDSEDIVLTGKKIFKNSEQEYTFTIRPSLVNASSAAQNLNKGLYPTNYLGGGYYDQQAINIYRGPIGLITDNPSDYLDRKNGIVASSYIGGSFTKNFSLSLGYNEFNVLEGIKSFSFATSRGCYQIQVDPPLTKVNTQQMKIDFPMTIRHTR